MTLKKKIEDPTGAQMTLGNLGVFQPLSGITKVRATFPLMCSTLGPKGLQSRLGQFTYKFL